MKRILFPVLCTLLMMWGCDKDSCYYTQGEDQNELINKDAHNSLNINSLSSDGAFQLRNDILYDVTYNNGTFTLFYVRSNIYSLLFGGFSNGDNNSMNNPGKTGSVQPNLDPIPAQNLPTGIQDLNYIVDIYVLDNDKILYPPVYLPYYDKRKFPAVFIENSEFDAHELLLDRNQYSDVFKKSNQNNFTILEGSGNTVFFTIENENVYFHLDPTSSIFTDDVSEINMGHFHINSYVTTLDAVDAGGAFINPIISFDINIDLKLIKGEPHIAPIEVVRPVNKLYNITVYKKCIYASLLINSKTAIALEPDDFPVTYDFSGYYINQDGSTSILNSDGLEIAKYPSSYKLEVEEDECQIIPWK